jgi:hypothetical protein
MAPQVQVWQRPGVHVSVGLSWPKHFGFHLLEDPLDSIEIGTQALIRFDDQSLKVFVGSPQGTLKG